MHWIVYAMLFVDTVDMKIKACNAFNAMYVDIVDTERIYTFLPLTFLIFNQFSIRKKFWKAKTEGFSTTPSNTIHVDTVDTRHKYSSCISTHNFLKEPPQ